MPSNKVRTRFAPSPTGYMHVGNLRTALYTYLMAKHEDGTFILRIEDTDQGRYVEGAVDVIYNTLREAGLNWDEGPDIGGPVGPYVQSERMGMFKQYAEQLVAEGKAYYCFCTEERLEALHAEQRARGEMTHYDGCCRDLPEEEVKKRLAAGEPYVIRQKIPREGVTGFDDVVYGHIEVENSEMDDQILIKTDGMPTYNFANVVDDHLMGITHVIRGSEYLSSTPKYNLLYQAFGWEIPTYIHCPPVMKDAQNKLSKRNGDASYQDLVAKGYLTEAVLNYICLLGWSPKGEYAEQEIFSLEELIKIWSPDGISKSPAIFDIEKLTYFNANYLRNLPPEEFCKVAEPYIRQAVKNEAYSVGEIAALLQARCEKLTDISEKVDFFDALPEYGVEFYTNKKSKTNSEVSLDMLNKVLPKLESLPEWTNDAIHDMLVSFAEELGVKNATLMWPLRIAVAGKLVTPGGAVEICHILGREETIKRVKAGIAKLA
jgi:glutamyl-tRNA synthetase